MLKRTLVFLSLIFLFHGCTKDDICPENTATTPQLVIVFRNFANPAALKKVEYLTVATDNEASIQLINLVATDSIAIPLNTVSDTTKYKFIRSQIIENDTLINVDKVSFIYSRKEIYVNRACGFRDEFENLRPILEDEGSENWIMNITINRDTIQDERKAHLTFFH